MAAPATAEEIRDVNTRYHDGAAAGYDAKWGIDFGEPGQAQVLGKLRKALGGRLAAASPRSLEIGAGTGYFSLNLLQAGVVGDATCTDISPGMLDALRGQRRAARASTSRRVAADAERLPFEDGSLRPRPRPRGAAPPARPRRARSASSAACCARAASSSFAGEPSRHGDRLARLPSAPRCARRAAVAAADRRAQAGGSTGRRATAAPRPRARALRRRPRLHARRPRAPRTRRRLRRRRACAARSCVANWFGWANRTLEATAEPDDVPCAWRQYAYRGYLALQQLDRALLEPRLPPAIFYNLHALGAQASPVALPRSRRRRSAAWSTIGAG